MSNQTPTNLLPFDGTVHYYGVVMDDVLASKLFNELYEHIEWQHDEAVMFGKRIITKRKVAWYASEPFTYTYSRTTKTAKPWTPALLTIKELIEQVSGETYNACLLNLYHTGDEGMAWHNDSEKELKKHGAIASVSLGAERKFAFKHRETKEKVEVWLENGSLLIMKDETQDHWLHRLPPTKKVHEPRINLTFRTIEKN